jgi:hypothetical protein
MNALLIIIGFISILVGSVMVCDKNKPPNWHIAFYFLFPLWVIVVSIMQFKLHKLWSFMTIIGFLLLALGLIV